MEVWLFVSDGGVCFIFVFSLLQDNPTVTECRYMTPILSLNVKNTTVLSVMFVADYKSECFSCRL